MHGCICSDSPVPEWWALPTHADKFGCVRCVARSAARPRAARSHGQRARPRRQPFQAYVLTGFTTGNYARSLQKLTTAELKKLCCDTLDEIFGITADPRPATLTFVDIAVKDWTADRLIRGGYR